jgi:microcin C transport system permease protein
MNRWQRFKANRLGYTSLWIFLILFGLSVCAELIANDKPLVVRYQGQFYFPILQSQPETVFGGDFATPTDFLDPDIRRSITSKGNWAVYPPIPYSFETLNYFAKSPNPAAPSMDNWLGTDDRGRDVLARYHDQHRKATLPMYIGTNTIVSLYTNTSPLGKLARKSI